MKYSLILIILLLITSPVQSLETKSIQYTYYLQSDFPEDMMEQIRKKVDQSGGFVSYYDTNKIVLRVPTNKSNDLIKFIQSSTFVQDMSLISKNIANELIDTEAKLTVKLQMLQKLYEIFLNSTLIQTLDTEGAVNNYIYDIEQLKGTLRYLSNQIVMTRMTIYMNQNVEKTKKSNLHYSKWEWVNQLSIENLISN